MITKEEIAASFKQLQDSICSSLETVDGTGKFSSDKWLREAGGGGLTRAITNGSAIEKGCVNFSEVSGSLPLFLADELRLKDRKSASFYATGVSVVMHPVNPWVPIIHMNVRYFEVSDPEGKQQFLFRWFGGGIDLTPHYINAIEAKQFHSEVKRICDKHHPTYYKTFKKEADEYFFLKHRDETRGIGGIFFDKLIEIEGIKLVQRFQFVTDLGNLFAPLYIPMILNNTKRTFSDDNKQWQLVRRGRYAEFNLIYDRGTKFGLETKGRTESILLSLPPFAKWIYDFVPKHGSEEEKTMKCLIKGMNWIN